MRTLELFGGWAVVGHNHLIREVRARECHQQPKPQSSAHVLSLMGTLKDKLHYA